MESLELASRDHWLETENETETETVTVTVTVMLAYAIINSRLEIATL